MKYDINRKFIWTGDLGDDCVCRWNGLIAHCEYLDTDSWHFSVGGRNAYMHWAEVDLRALTGQAARQVCEWYMKQHIAGRMARC